MALVARLFGTPVTVIPRNGETVTITAEQPAVRPIPPLPHREAPRQPAA